MSSQPIPAPGWYLTSGVYGHDSSGRYRIDWIHHDPVAYFIDGVPHIADGTRIAAVDDILGDPNTTPRFLWHVDQVDPNGPMTTELAEQYVRQTLPLPEGTS